MSSSEDSGGEDRRTYGDIESMKAKELQQWLKEHNCKRSGNKAVLINRVWRAMNGDSTSESSDSDTDIDATIPPWNDENWKQLETHLIPPISSKDVDNYFLYQKNPVSGKKRKCQRQLTKAKKLCNEQGYLTHVSINSNIDDCTFIKANCRPSMKSGLYEVRVALTTPTGRVDGGVCTCKAGLSGVCAHVGALLMNLVKITNPCTGRLAGWVEPQTDGAGLSPARWEDLTFRKTDKPETVVTVKPYPGIYKASSETDPSGFLKDLLAGLGEVNPDCTLFQMLCVTPPNLETIMSVFFAPEDAYVFKDCDLKSVECEIVFDCFLNQIQLTHDECSQIERATRGQSTNPHWNETRHHLLTASKFGAVVKRKSSTPPDCLLKVLRGYSTVNPLLEPLAYGRKMEHKARKDYMQHHLLQCGHAVHIEDRGLLLNPSFPYLGASIDGLVSCETCGQGIVELKCPYKLKNGWPKDGPSLIKSFCSKDIDGELILQKTHNYYFQVQGQLAVYNLKWADFVIWTKKGISVERISFDAELWKMMHGKLREFYRTAVIPEIFTERVKNHLPLFD